VSFTDLGLNPSLVATLTNLGYEAPTPIQERTIPVLLAGRDLIGQAQTGTGKTAAFALPILEKIDVSRRDTQALVLAPTRELAMQVAEALHSYAHGMKALSVLPVYGGAPIMPQVKRLERGVHVVVGTPGRLIDMLDRRSLKLDTLRLLVLDEADEMLKMGFIEDVEKLLAAAPAERQIALFSATMPPEILRIAKRYMPNAERVEIERKTMTAPKIEQRFLNVAESQKMEALTQILELEENDAVLIFRRTKNGAAELAERLDGRGFAAVAMHGDMNQRERENVIKRLRAGQIEIVVATDVAARGLDVEQISHVINYDIPHDVEAYVHRIGRTGRAGRTGIATLFVTPRERRMKRDIEHFTGSEIKPMKMPSQADVAARRVQQLKDTIRKNMAEGDLDMYLKLVEELAEEGGHDLAEIAAAAARLASIARPIAETAPQPVAAAAPRPFVERREDAPGVRLSMSVGKRDGIRPADVVGSIANEADIPGRDIGPIDIRDTITYVTVPAEHAEQVLERVGRAKFRGRPLDLQIAKDAPPPRPRPSFDRDARPPRFERDAKPRFDRDAKPRFERSGPPRGPGARGPAPRGGAPRVSRGGPARPAGRPTKPGPKKRY
jgi:ATP-dependent RNA helicase DeaD